MEGKQPRPAERAQKGARVVPWLWPARGGAAADLRLRLELAFAEAAERFRRALVTETERRSWFNWLPVAFGCGIGAYFLADREPLWWGPGAGIAVMTALAVAARTRPVLLGCFVVVLAMLAGLQAAVWRTQRIDAPVLDRIRIGELTGFIESIEERTADMRLVLRVTAFAGLEPAALPARVRITSARRELASGAHVAMSARLTPPPEAARPGGYDFARDAYFRGIGAVGSVLGPISHAPAPGPMPFAIAVNARIDAARNEMTARIAGLIGGQAGALAAALVTGKRGLLNEDTNTALRGAGLYHIVSISGLHMVLAAGAIFWMSRAMLALAAPLALGWPIKKLAALLAMFGATAYCVFSGAEVATERSLIMTLIMLGAILVDRPALSLRNLAFAALLVLALEPDALLGPSFQMSFAAVAALVSFAEWQRRRPRQQAQEPDLIARSFRSIRLAALGLVLTSVLAGAATGPFGAFHFQTWNPYGLIGNVMALPLVSLVVMPAAVMGALLYPLGLDGLAWWVMGYATEPVLIASRFVAGFAGSTRVVPALGLGSVLAFGSALLLLTLLSTWLRWLGLVPLAAAVLLSSTGDRPDIYIDRDGTGAMVRDARGLLVPIGRPSGFVMEQWLKADGDSRSVAEAGKTRPSPCDVGGCVVRLGTGQAVAWSRDPPTISEDCHRATLVITPLRWNGDHATLDRFGAFSIRATADGLVPRTARDPQARRSWSRRPTTTTLPPVPVAGPSVPVNSDEPD
jgi:competence protein ComEC